MAIGDIRLKAILFGCDNWGTVIWEEVPYKNERGIWMKKYLIIPLPEMIEMYPKILKIPGAINIDTPRGKAMWVEYPTDLIVDENPSRTNAIVRVLCGFDGRDTPHTKKTAKIFQQNLELQSENENLRISNIVLNEEKEELMKDILRQAKKYAEIIEVMRGGRREEEEDEEHEPRE